MSEEATIIESSAPPEVQAKAEKLGWIPPSRFKGDPERFVDAELYIERGEQVLPIVKEHNRRLERQVGDLQGELGKTAAALQAAQTAIEQIEERHSVETQKAVERARREVKAQLAAASESGDHEGVAELTDQLTKLNTASPEAPAKKPAALPPPKIDADLVEWQAQNTWFGKDNRRTALALGIAQEFREAGDRSVGREFYEKIGAEVAKTLNGHDPGATSGKVEGARNGGGGEARGGSKSYHALPADAKAACDADARKFVGEGKRYKTAGEWQKRYAELYFQE